MQNMDMQSGFQERTVAAPVIGQGGGLRISNY